MHIVVCVKQVPDTANVRINPETNTLMREGVESITNPFDENALEQALRIKDSLGARVTVLTMGPPQAEITLREAMARGADDAVLLSDRAFAGADTWATSYVIAQAVKKFKPTVDLVLFGKQAIDGDTAQVGPGVSEFLKYPLVTYSRAFDVQADGRFTAETVMDDRIDVIEGQLPAVVTVVRESAAARYASLAGWMQARNASVKTWGVKSLKAAADLCGLQGSPTRVVKIFPPAVKSGGTRMDGREMPSAAVDAVVSLLRDKGVLR